MAISKKTRFEVFERDDFRCRYCGRTPFDDGVILEADHAISKKDGGNDEKQNLVTSCFDCNRGKSKKSIAPKINIKEQLKHSKEQLEQIRAMTKLISKQREVKQEKFTWLQEALKDYSNSLFGGMKRAVKNCENKGVEQKDIIDSVDIALDKFLSYDEFYTKDFVKYFYGIIRNKQNG